MTGMIVLLRDKQHSAIGRVEWCSEDLRNFRLMQSNGNERYFGFAKDGGSVQMVEPYNALAIAIPPA
jgi:hypothetical protein